MAKREAAFPDIDPRIHGVGVSTLRRMNTETLSQMKDELYLIHAYEQPVAVLISYETYMKLQRSAEGRAQETKSAPPG